MDETPKKKIYDEFGTEILDAVTPEEAARQVAEAKAQAEADSKAKQDEAEKAHQADLDRIKEENRQAILASQTKLPEGMVAVDAGALEDLKRRLERVEGASDVGRLAKMDAKNRKEPAHVVRLGLWTGQVIIGWQLKKNTVEKINGAWRELQTIELKLNDNTAVEVPYLEFVQNTVKVDATIVSRTKEDDMETLKVRRNDNGEQILIDVRFVNL